jgi:hypothetical protein
MLMKKTIVIFSNPFGYGPTGKAIAIAEAFINSGYINIIFAGNNFVQEIVPFSITSISVDERNEDEIIKVLKQIENPMVVSSQNRFAIRAAKSLDVPSAFLDGLAWFWKEVPHDHLIADEIFWMNYPHIKDKLPKNSNKIHIVPAIVDVKNNVDKKDKILVHIGGCKNPLTEVFPKYYLDILAKGLSNISNADKVTITGGVEAIEYLKSLLLEDKSKIKAVSLKHHEFIHELSESKHFITTAGQTATLEALALGIPTSFLLPTNLSQLALTNVLAEYNAAPQALYWDSYFPEKIDIAMLSEKEAIVQFNKYAENIKNDQKLNQTLVLDLLNIINTIPNQKGQSEFIKHIGVSGANAIKDILCAKWNLI